MNPASSHPPSRGGSISLKARTPRTSLIGPGAGPSEKDADVYGEKSLEEDEPVPISSNGLTYRNGSVRVQEVWRELFLTSNGRDKGLVSFFTSVPSELRKSSPMFRARN